MSSATATTVEPPAPASVQPEVPAPMPVPIAPSPAPVPVSSVEKVKMLEDILASKNDNDPRLDSEFNNLTDNDKAALQKKYSDENREKLNERGTIVYLLGRTISSSHDLVFIKQVTEEPICNNFENCNAIPRDDDSDHTGANDVTLAYPQVMALKSLERFLQTNPQDYALKQQSLEIVNTAAGSRNDVVARMARQILDQSGQN